VLFPLTPTLEKRNAERRTPNVNEISPCTLRLLTPALSSFGEERETVSGVRQIREHLRW
jgi:hypothetical protein